MYDYVIVGCGPSGLTLAWILSQYGKRIMMIDREETIGGCHRVRRVGEKEYFTEHGPRIYTTNGLNFRRIYEEMGGKYDETFVKYDFGMTQIGGMSVKTMYMKEIFWLVMAYLNLMINGEYGKDETVLEYVERHDFSEETKDYLNRLCRLSDGAGSDRYTMNEFMQILNQNFFYDILQPREPNDKGFLKLWKEALDKTGRVEFLMNNEVMDINVSEKMVESIRIKNVKSGNVMNIRGDRYILAIPPTNLMEILNNSMENKIRNSFGEMDELKEWEKESRYLTYVPITFHWKKKQKIPKKWGFTKSDWGLVYIILSDYMKDIENGSATVISTCLTIDNNKSKRIGKTVNESDIEELKRETYQQLKDAIKELDEPDEVIVSPGFYRDEKENKWRTKDNSFIVTKQGYLKERKSKEYENLYTLGTHNGRHYYDFTSIESAVSNAISMSNELIPESRNKYEIKGLISMLDVAKLLIIIMIIMIIIYLYRRR